MNEVQKKIISVIPIQCYRQSHLELNQLEQFNLTTLRLVLPCVTYRGQARPKLCQA